MGTGSWLLDIEGLDFAVRIVDEEISNISGVVTFTSGERCGTRCCEDVPCCQLGLVGEAIHQELHALEGVHSFSISPRTLRVRAVAVHYQAAILVAIKALLERLVGPLGNTNQPKYTPESDGPLGITA